MPWLFDKWRILGGLINALPQGRELPAEHFNEIWLCEYYTVNLMAVYIYVCSFVHSYAPKRRNNNIQLLYNLHVGTQFYLYTSFFFKTWSVFNRWIERNMAGWIKVPASISSMCLKYRLFWKLIYFDSNLSSWHAFNYWYECFCAGLC